MAYFCIAWYIAEYGKKQAKRYQEYELLYDRITFIIQEYDITEQTYDYLMKLLERLGQMKYKDKEKTSVLTIKFLTKYKEIREKRLEIK